MEHIAHDSRRRRQGLLLRFERFLDLPVALLGLAWLVLLVIELTRGLSPFLEGISLAIWGVFVVDFGVKLAIAPDRHGFVRANWLALLSLFVPALRVFRIFRALRVLRAARTLRGIRLVKIVGTLNRGMRALRHGFEGKGFAYVLGLTLVVNLAGAAGMYALERDVQDPEGLHDFGTALWWTAMMLTTMGSQYWPRTPEGRALSLLIATYAFAIFGYITAVVASLLIGKREESPAAEVRGKEAASAALDELVGEVRALRAEIESLRGSSSSSSGRRYDSGEIAH